MFMGIPTDAKRIGGYHKGQRLDQKYRSGKIHRSFYIERFDFLPKKGPGGVDEWWVKIGGEKGRGLVEINSLASFLDLG